MKVFVISCAVFFLMTIVTARPLLENELEELKRLMDIQDIGHDGRSFCFTQSLHKQEFYELYV